MDTEIEAMSAVATALEGLDDSGRSRVLRWAADRFGVALTGGNRRQNVVRIDTGEDNLSDDDIAAEAPEFEHFAELFAAAQPKTNEDKALVVAYWLQVFGAQDSWQSRALNVELKNLGHAIPNITDALTGNMKKRPQRIIQLQKSGSSRQAQKTYKVTHEGLVYVQGMLSGANGRQHRRPE